jgi:hypothetical protein
MRIVNQEPIQLGSIGKAQVEIICQQLAHWMPKPIRVPLALRRDMAQPKGYAANGLQRSRRNAEVRRLRDEEKLSLTKIAIRVGLTKQRVSQILNEAA